MAISFPLFPRDPESQLHLAALQALSHKISLREDISETLNLTRAFLHVISDSPYNYDYVYFRLHQGLSEDYVSLKDHYNHYIYRQGMEYMLGVLNREIGDFADYFNDFQVIMDNIDKRSKYDQAYAPLNTLIWGLYCSMYDRKKLKAYLNKSVEILVQIKSEEHLVMCN